MSHLKHCCTGMGAADAPPLDKLPFADLAAFSSSLAQPTILAKLRWIQHEAVGVSQPSLTNLPDMSSQGGLLTLSSSSFRATRKSCQAAVL